MFTTIDGNLYPRTRITDPSGNKGPMRVEMVSMWVPKMCRHVALKSYTSRCSALSRHGRGSSIPNLEIENPSGD